MKIPSSVTASPQAVERIFRVRKRDLGKPFIILISHIDEIELFGIHLSTQERGFEACVARASECYLFM